MTPDLKAQLLAKYPLLLVQPSILAIGDGWFWLIDGLCDALQRDADQGLGSQVVLESLSEKYGTLRIELATGSTPRQDGMVELAETLSHSICDVCGNPGTLDEKSAWMKVRCQTHR